jgi:hypothetical protein
MSGRRHRVPAGKSAKKQKGVILIARSINRARAMLFEVGIVRHRRGRDLAAYVDDRCPPHM